MSNKKFMNIILAVIVVIVGILVVKTSSNPNSDSGIAQTDKDTKSDGPLTSTSSSEEEQGEQKGTSQKEGEDFSVEVNNALLEEATNNTDPEDVELNKQLRMAANGTGYIYLFNLKEQELMGDGYSANEYKTFNKVISVNDEVNLALSGCESDSKILYLDLTILDKDYDNGIGGEGYNYSDFKTLNTDSASKTEDDTERLVKFINDNQRYPNKGEVQLNGIITFEQYKSLFDQFDLKGREVQTIVGKSL